MNWVCKNINWVALVGVISLQGGIQAETLSGAFHRMLENDPELRAAGWDSKAAEYQARAARGGLRPQVALNGSAGFSRRDRSVDGLQSDDGQDRFSRQLGISLRQLLFDGNSTYHGVKSAEARAELQKFLEMGARETRTVDLVEVYLEVLRNHEQIAAARAHVASYRKIHELAVAKFEGGGEEADSALLEGRLSLAESALDTQKLQLQRAQGRYLHLVGDIPSDLTPIAQPALPSSLEVLDLANNWDFQAARIGHAAAVRDAKSSKGSRWPSLSADVGYSVGEDTLGIAGRDNEFHALVVGSWNVFDGGTRKASINRSEAMVEKALDLITTADRERKLNAKIAWMERSGTNQALQSLKKYHSRLSKVVGDYEDGFEVGKRDILQILDMKGEEYGAKTQLIDARYEHLASGYRIMGIAGTLAESLVGQGSSKNPSSAK